MQKDVHIVFCATAALFGCATALGLENFSPQGGDANISLSKAAGCDSAA
jgi:hypothetical protein